MQEDDTHKCPIGACDKRVPPDKLMCPGDWRTVPAPLKKALYRAWNYGRGKGSDAHNRAMQRCIEAATRRAGLPF